MIFSFNTKMTLNVPLGVISHVVNFIFMSELIY